MEPQCPWSYWESANGFTICPLKLGLVQHWIQQWIFNNQHWLQVYGVLRTRSSLLTWCGPDCTHGHVGGSHRLVVCLRPSYGVLRTWDRLCWVLYHSVDVDGIFHSVLFPVPIPKRKGPYCVMFTYFPSGQEYYRTIIYNIYLWSPKTSRQLCFQGYANYPKIT